MDRKRWVGFDTFDEFMKEALEELEPETLAEVIELNANVIDIEPPDTAA